TMTEIPTSYYLATGEEGGESGRPPYRARDGWVIISGTSREMTRRLMELIGMKVNPDEPGMMPSFKSAEPRVKALVDWCAAHTMDEIVTKLTELGIPSAPVLTTPQVAKDPHLWEREMLVKMPDPVAGEMYLPGLTIKFSKTPGKL